MSIGERPNSTWLFMTVCMAHVLLNHCTLLAYSAFRWLSDKKKGAQNIEAQRLQNKAWAAQQGHKWPQANSHGKNSGGDVQQNHCFSRTIGSSSTNCKNTMGYHGRKACSYCWPKFPRIARSHWPIPTKKSTKQQNAGVICIPGLVAKWHRPL